MTTLHIFAVDLPAQQRPAAEPERSGAAPRRRRWLVAILSWLVRRRKRPGDLPEHFRHNNHLRRDIGLHPVWPDGWPH